ncbi:hypothetical protein A2627_02290 [Candidatus Woesebacteria bacterium RIFCSPHIGHO2_01_FULL_39_28]|uniref:DUF7402 domain-containing protein n=1 Tax=Candidatus Woesebacteria bacterium RIFCSPHIGHO2_01_FULL_39_28 TaxID=1802496 RepID=A0A1F7YF77_9BACT|nr:MAG: hypothetical protein A2627_02290 [Candidatus Woesebacteria bacterium RIFCSPHIGHO2_01_FULL_39_28]
MNTSPKKTFITIILTLGCLTLFIIFSSLSTAHAATSCPNGTTLNIVAHEDDDLLFLSPDLFHNIQAGKCIVTVFVTSGDANGSSFYWLGRENGSKAAYAQMAGVSNSWTQNDAGLTGHPIPIFNLDNNSTVSLIFMRLPDGNVNGSGFPNNNNESLQKIWQSGITTIHPVDGSSSYTKQDIINSLTFIINIYQPDKINTQDFVGSYNDGDHSDHHTTAYFAQAANQSYPKLHTFTAYLGYPISSLPINVLGNDAIAKQNAFLAYAPYDLSVCQTLSYCQLVDYGQWLVRQYTNGGPTPTPISPNIASQAVVTASTQSTQDNQLAVKTVDGFIDGYPGDYTHEWATLGKKSGA